MRKAQTEDFWQSTLYEAQSVAVILLSIIRHTYILKLYCTFASYFLFDTFSISLRRVSFRSRSSSNCVLLPIRPIATTCLPGAIELNDSSFHRAIFALLILLELTLSEPSVYGSRRVRSPWKFQEDRPPELTIEPGRGIRSGESSKVDVYSREKTHGPTFHAWPDV